MGKGRQDVSSPRHLLGGGGGGCLENQQHQTEQSTDFSRSATHIFQNKKLRHREEKELVQSCVVTAAILGEII